MSTQKKEENGNNPGVKVVTTPVNRVRASGPILILAILFVVASFLTWYFTWFGRGLSDSEITQFLVDQKHPRHVQHALLQVQQRIERGDQSVKQWYPQIVALGDSSETEFRLTAAWLMGADNTSDVFHDKLKKLLADPEPIVRRNAALALVRFGDPSGGAEIASMLHHFTVTAPTTGTVISTLSSGAQVSRGALLARIQPSNKEEATLRSPLNGTVDVVFATNGHNISTGDPFLTLKSDEQSLWEALRALSIVGQPEDLWLVDHYASGAGAVSARIKEQAAQTANAIKGRANYSNKNN